ncbi:hypothetical protein F5H01DRAFT_371235 [Linnemannia elongata]|nr:hypothetical protein F5H01DRAFT_371235 [Linnemannia elongata]
MTNDRLNLFCLVGGEPNRVPSLAKLYLRTLSMISRTSSRPRSHPSSMTSLQTNSPSGVFSLLLRPMPDFVSEFDFVRCVPGAVRGDDLDLDPPSKSDEEMILANENRPDDKRQQDNSQHKPKKGRFKTTSGTYGALRKNNEITLMACFKLNNKDTRHLTLYQYSRAGLLRPKKDVVVDDEALVDQVPVQRSQPLPPPDHDSEDTGAGTNSQPQMTQV